MRNTAIEHQQVASRNFNNLIGQPQPYTADEGVNRDPSIYPMFFRLRVLLHGD
jgi:hypothetical protein